MVAAVLPPPGQSLAPNQATATMNKALGLVAKGYHVFPVLVRVDPATGANTKTYVTGRAESPVGAKWNATVDAELVRSWWGPGGRFGDCMIGIATEPSGVVLIDADVKHDIDGPAEWKELHPQPYPFPAAVGTSSTGGRHYAYRAQPKRPVRTDAGKLAPALDTRGVGGMFVCWSPWLPSVRELPVVPDVVPERVPYVKRGSVVVTSPVDGRRIDDGTVQARVLEHARIVEQAVDGTGIPTASRQAYFVGQYVGAGQVDLGWARAVLLAAVADWTWKRPGDHERVQQQLLKGVDDGAREPRAWLSEPELVDPAQLATVSVLRPRQEPATPRPEPVPALPVAEPVTRPQELQAEVSAPTPVPPVAESEAAPRRPLPTVLDPGSARFAPDDDEVDDGVAVPAGRRVVLTPLSAIPIRRARWLWDGRIPLGALTLVAGKQGLGKSTVVYDLVTRLTRGELGGEFHGVPRSALVCATEDSWSETIKPRLVAAGVDESMVFRVEAKIAEFDANLVLPDDLLAVEQAARQVDAALLVLDPLTSRLSTGLDMHKDSETRRALEPLVAMLGRARMSGAGLMHLNKSGKADPMDAVMGATAFTAVARSVLIVMPDPDDEERRRKFVGLAKNNLGRLDLPMLAFRTVSAMVPTDEPDDDRPAEVGRIEWLEEVEGSIGDAMERAAQDPETRTAIGDAAAWLKDYLTACGGSAESAAIRDAGRSDGHNAKTLSRALKKIGGRAESLKVVPRRTIWTLPLKAPKPLQIEAANPRRQQMLTSEDNTPQTQNIVSTVLTVSTSEDSGASGPQKTERGHAVRTEGDPETSSHPTTPADPPWMADEPHADVTQSERPPCPCGRAQRLHSRGNWRTCAAGHQWHGHGHGALDACPQCPAAALMAAAPDGAA